MRVGKTRKSNKHLPRRMYLKSGTYWFVDKANKWTKLGVDYAKALHEYSKLVDDKTSGTVGALFDRYEREILPRQAAETRKGRKKEFKQLRENLGHMFPAHIEPSDVWGYFEDRGENQAALHEIRALSAVLSWSVKWGVLKSNPLLGIQWAKGKKKFRPRDRYVTDEEFIKVRDCASPMVRYAMNIALITGARQTDILLLDRKQVAAGMLKVTQSKTGKRVDYPLAGSLEENIAAALSHAPQVRQFVIVNRAGKPYTMDGFQTQWKRAVTKAFPNKADRFMFRDLRAKSISDANSLEEARVRAGHSDSRITQRVYRRLPDVATVMDITHLKGKK